MRIKLYIDPQAEGGPALIGVTENGETVNLVLEKRKLSQSAVRIGTAEVGETAKGPHGFAPSKDSILRWFEARTTLTKRTTIRATHGGGLLFLYRGEAKLLANAIGLANVSTEMLGFELSNTLEEELAALSGALMFLGPTSSGPKPRLDARRGDEQE